MEEKKITIIGMDSCEHCTEAKEFCEKEGLHYEFIDIIDDKNQKYIKEVIAEDKLTVPKICTDSELLHCLIGFDEKKLRELLNH